MYQLLRGSLLNHHQCAASTWMMQRQPQDNGASALTTHQLQVERRESHMALFHCMVRHGTVRYGSLLGGFPLGTVPGTWYFFSTTSVEVPSSRTVTKTWRVNSADHWMAGENRHYCVTELATRDPPLPARFKSAQPAKDRTQLLFKQTHIFA